MNNKNFIGSRQSVGKCRGDLDAIIECLNPDLYQKLTASARMHLIQWWRIPSRILEHNHSEVFLHCPSLESLGSLHQYIQAILTKHADLLFSPHQPQCLTSTSLVSGTIVVLTRGLGIGTHIDQCGYISRMKIDPDNLAATVGRDALYVDITSAHFALGIISKTLPYCILAGHREGRTYSAA